MVNPGKKSPGEKSRQPMISASAAIQAACTDPNFAANTAMGMKPKPIRTKGVCKAKICVKIITSEIKIPERIIRVVRFKENTSL